MSRIKRHPMLDTPYEHPEPPGAERNGHHRANGKPASKPQKRPQTTGRFQTNAFADGWAHTLEPIAQLCWFHLWREVKSNGNASISHGQIAKRIGKSRRTIIRAIKQLEAAKLISVVKRGSKADGPSVYRLHNTPHW